MSFIAFFSTFLFSPQVYSEDCALQAQRLLPRVLVVADGTIDNWEAHFGHDYSEAVLQVQRLRGSLFKLGRIKKVPLFSTTYISLNGDTHSLYFPNKKVLEDQAAPVFGIYPEDLSALVENYKLMQAYFGDRLKNSAYFRLRNLFISCLLYTSPSPRDATLSRMPSSA